MFSSRSQGHPDQYCDSARRVPASWVVPRRISPCFLPHDLQHQNGNGCLYGGSNLGWAMEGSGGIGRGLPDSSYVCGRNGQAFAHVCGNVRSGTQVPLLASPCRVGALHKTSSAYCIEDGDGSDGETSERLRDKRQYSKANALGHAGTYRHSCLQRPSFLFASLLALLLTFVAVPRPGLGNGSKTHARQVELRGLRQHILCTVDGEHAPIR